MDAVTYVFIDSFVRDKDLLNFYPVILLKTSVQGSSPYSMYK